MRSPARPKASKRKTEAPHPEERDNKFIATAESPMQDGKHFDISTPVGGSTHPVIEIPEVPDEEMSSIEQTSLSSTDCMFLCGALIGKDMTEVVGPTAVNRIEQAVDEVLGVDIMEMYSPKKPIVTLVQGPK